MVSPLDPMFNNTPLSMWDVLADGLAAQGITPQSMMAYSDVVPNPRRSGTGSIGRPSMGQPGPNMGQPPANVKPPTDSMMDPFMPPQEAPGYNKPGKSQERVPQAAPSLGPPVGWQGPLQPEEAGSPLDPQPSPQPEPGGGRPPGAPLDLAPPNPTKLAQRGDSTQMALAGLKAMTPEKAYIPPPPSLPRPDTGGLPRIDPTVIMQNLQRAGGGQVPLLLLSQLLGRG